MADIKVENQRTSQGRQPVQQRGTQSGTPARRGEEGWLNPFALMRRLSDEMDRAFATSFGLPSAWGHPGAGMEESLWSPPIEVREEGNNLVVCAELPGINKDDVKVEVTDQGLLIQGERKREHEEKREGYYRTERSYGQFYRTVPLPEGIDPEKAKAEFKDGLLRVEVPIPESMQHKRREIPIKS